MTRQEIKDRLKSDFGNITTAASLIGIGEAHLTMILNGDTTLVLSRLGIAVEKWSIPVEDLEILLSERDRKALPQLKEALRDS